MIIIYNIYLFIFSLNVLYMYYLVNCLYVEGVREIYRLDILILSTTKNMINLTGILNLKYVLVWSIFKYQTTFI